MASQSVAHLKATNERLLESNRNLKQTLKVMDKFRVLLISMVNNCKCNTETNIRVTFNLLMEDYYGLERGRQRALHPPVGPHHLSTPSSTERRTPPLQTKGEAKETTTEATKDSDLRERIARLRRYVSRPKIFSRLNRTRVRTSQTYECSWPGCDSVFKAKVDMKTHLWRHTGEKIYACQWPGCEKRFPVKRNLQRHFETHEGVKQFACDWPGCEYKSWYPQGVRAHKKRHTDERPHKCTWPSCEWTFRQSHHLKAHMLKHTGEKPFPCVSCDQRFQSRQAMKFHFDRSHPKKS